MPNVEPQTHRDMTNNIKREHRKVILIVHFGDEQFRGSERCIFNLILGLSKDRYSIILWSNHKQLSELSADHAEEIILSDFKPSLGFNYDAKANDSISGIYGTLKNAFNITRRAKPDLIICNSLAPCQWMVPASLSYNVPLVAYLHTNYLSKTRISSLAFGASHIVGVSKFTLDRFIKDRYPHNRLSVVYNGVADLSLIPTDRQITRDELGIEHDAFVIISICALVDWKKVDLIIDAFRLLSVDDTRPTVLLIAGDGPCLEELKQRAQGLRVVFCGWRADVASLFSAADCTIVAAEREAFALTVIESATMNVPIIAAKAGGVAEYIVDGVNGLYAEPGSETSFADAMHKMRSNPALRKKLAATGRRDYEARFKVEHMVEHMRTIIDEFCDNPASKSPARASRLYRLISLSLRLVFNILFSKLRTSS